eukprot:CAMPEP_0201147110 /NCGR_PEP_ID=MMETSP0851-20130426/8702_1 /ASSEMBLY_ACC=CAM_ASM_000631 /TAXON_ID=183588 /ORGANISM="Pseudo-nitzschia fraudulenta, Strain WWA7" /LENGTH=591 /DNA_ID=CAMNT_0047422863 /DNA_START=85 /DNA_END=1860 /DNA_ORIENTATION=+
MSSPGSKRIAASPSPKKLSSSPRGNNHGRSNRSRVDLFYAGFLRHVKWLLGLLVVLAILRNATTTPPYLFNTTSYKNLRDSVSTEATTPTTKPPTSRSIPQASEIGTYHHKAPENQKPKRRSDDTDGAETPIPRAPTRPSGNGGGDAGGEKDAIVPGYRASDCPVILDGWNRTVQVHLIVDVTGSQGIDPASKLLLAGVKRSEHTQLKAVTFVQPAIETMEVFPRRQDLPLLFLIDWGSMDRDCHRLQLVLENLRETTPPPAPEETEEPYFLLVDSSGSTRRTGCDYLFRSSTSSTDDSSSSSSSSSSGSTEKTIAYAHTNDHNRIRLAKRSIVQNRYYDHETKKIHSGELSPNRWDGVPMDYDRPILQIPFSLRESFVMSIQNITGGIPVTNEDSKRLVDVGCFWKSGDYSHYGFYRRDIAKVVKTLHHSTLDRATGQKMNNLVQISYTDEKGMEAGNVQYKYTEQLLGCKIVVIAQRDGWEDHYRLTESLASGALVMTDPMVALPPGLVDGVNIVVYDSPEMLKERIKHYLKPENKKERKRIALKGYRLVMGKHRSWHRLEELLFGKPLTHANDPNAPAPEKETLPGGS